MEAIFLLGGLALTGYQINKDVTKEDRKVKTVDQPPIPNEIPNPAVMSTVARQMEQEQANEMFPLRLNNVFSGVGIDKIKSIPEQYQTHNNMTPYFSGSSNRYLNASDSINQRHTGIDQYTTPKTERYTTEVQDTQFPLQQPQEMSSFVNDQSRQVLTQSLPQDLNYFSMGVSAPIDRPKIQREDVDSNKLAGLYGDPRSDPRQVYETPFVPGRGTVAPPTNPGFVSTQGPETTFDIEGRAVGNRAFNTSTFKFDNSDLVNTNRGEDNATRYGNASMSMFNPINSVKTNYRSNNQYGETTNYAQMPIKNSTLNDQTEYIPKDTKRGLTEEEDISEYNPFRRVIHGLVKQFDEKLSRTKKDELINGQHTGFSRIPIHKDAYDRTKIYIRHTAKQYVTENKYIAPASMSNTKRGDDEIVETRSLHRKVLVKDIVRNMQANSNRMDNPIQPEYDDQPDRAFEPRTNGRGGNGTAYEPSMIGQSTKETDNTTNQFDRFALDLQVLKNEQSQNPFLLDISK